jgi:hypothetical protein
LKQAVGAESFGLYLAIEDAVNEHCAELVARVWRIARGQGRRLRSRNAKR